MGQLKQNGNDLNDVIAIANALPDRGSGEYENGYTDGYADGLAARKYETWTFTLADGSVIEKEVALL